jgi:Phage integrase family
VADAGLNPDEVVRHTLRHTTVSHLVQAGVDLPTVKRISGHKTLAMVERYAHQNSEHIGEAMNALENRYANSTSAEADTITPILHTEKSASGNEDDKTLKRLVAKGGIEPPTQGFSVLIIDV